MTAFVSAETIENAVKKDPGTSVVYWNEWHGEDGAPLVSGEHISRKFHVCSFDNNIPALS